LGIGLSTLGEWVRVISDKGTVPPQLADFSAAYNFPQRLKTLSGLTPYEYICKI
jgi:hypothetical protein